MKTVKFTEYQKQMMMIALVSAAAIILGVFAVILPDVKKLGYLQRDLDQVSARQDAMRAILQQEKLLKSMGTLVTPEKDRYLIMSQLTAVGNRYGLEVENITPINESSEGLFKPYRVQMSSKGSFHEIMSFLQGVTEMKPVVVVEKILVVPDSFSRGGRETAASPSLQVSLVLSALIQSGQIKG